MGTDVWGVDDDYRNAMGKRQVISGSTRAAVLKAMGVDISFQASPPGDPVRVVRPGEVLRLKSPGELTLEDGAVLPVEGSLPPDLPLGYHRLRLRGQESSLQIIAAPRHCFPPPSPGVWGWAVQLYSLRSAKSWGIGDFEDLREWARWSAGELAAGILLLNPVQATTPSLPQTSSPYFPSSRLFRNLLYLRVEEAPGAAEAGLDLDRLSEMGRELNRRPLIDRDAAYRLKTHAIEILWGRFKRDSAFERYCAEQGDALRQFSVFCALAERYGKKWNRWPAEYRHPALPAVSRFADEARERVGFYQWGQWLLDRQLARAAEEIPLMQDLPVGFDPDGADAWVWQDFLASEATIGAPPDEYNTLGQDWGLPPFIPHKLKAQFYEPFRQTLRAAFRHARGLRIDHVMGLFRLYWIPKGTEASAGAYVRYAAQDLLAIAALESHRAGAFVVGEDLGTVEDRVKKQLSRHRILSCRLVWFEKELPSHYPPMTLAAVTTHDLPTIAGLWSGHDLEKQEELGLHPNREGTWEIRNRLATMTGLPENAPEKEVILQTHRLLGEAPSAVTIATLEDALAVKDRPNMPNTTTEWPNWSIPLPVPLEEIRNDPFVREIGRALNRGRKH